MPTLNKDELKKISMLSSLLFCEDEIKIIMSNEDEIKSFKDAYEKGRLNEKFEIRKAIFKQAQSGNAQAQKHWMELSREAAIREKRKR